MIEIRQPKQEEVLRQKEVWQACFGDGEAFLDLVSQNYYGPKLTVVLLEVGQLSSMTVLLPMELRRPDGDRGQGGYVYALATDPAARKKGFARFVLRYADFYLKEQGKEAIFLVPASPSLHRFFQTAEYQECFATRKVELLRGQLSAPEAGDSIVPVGAETYNALRDTLLEGQFAIHYEDRLIRLQEDICRLSGPGAGLYRLEVGGVTGCAAVEYYQEDRILVKELLIPPAQMAGAAAQIAQVAPAGHYHLRTPSFWEGLPGSYIQAFGMMKWYDPAREKLWSREREGYLGLGFD